MSWIKKIRVFLLRPIPSALHLQCYVDGSDVDPGPGPPPPLTFPTQQHRPIAPPRPPRFLPQQQPWMIYSMNKVASSEQNR